MSVPEQISADALRAAYPHGRHDSAERRQALRKQRERGCSVYIPAEQLAKAGIDPEGPAPFYRTWSGPRGRVVIQLYKVK